jgi:hypothetical protein
VLFRIIQRPGVNLENHVSRRKNVNHLDIASIGGPARDQKLPPPLGLRERTNRVANHEFRLIRPNAMFSDVLDVPLVPAKFVLHVEYDSSFIR